MYIANRCSDNTNFGITKLYKLLFFADAAAYKSRQKTVTGDQYVKRQRGPTPKHALAELGTLDAKGELVTDVRNSGPYQLEVPIPTREAREGVLDASDLAFLDEAIEKYGHYSATKLSQLTHELPFWRWAKMNTDCDLELLLSKARVNLAQMSPREKSEAAAGLVRRRSA